MAERFERKLDAAIRSHQRLAADAAARAVEIDELRLLSEATVAPEHSVTGRAAAIARRVLVSEVACAFHLPERTAENLIEASRSLVHKLPSTLAALAAGRISYPHAQVIIDESATLTPEAAATFEEAVLPGAERQTVAQLKRAARIERERIDAESIRVRTERGVARRGVFFDPAHDGMAWLSAYLPAPEAAALYERVTHIAAGLHDTTEGRTLAQLRADVLVDLVLDPSGAASVGATGANAEARIDDNATDVRSATRNIKPDVCLMVPVLSLLGHGDEPAHLEGYGPIDIDAARELVGNATSFIRILTHPETGAILSVGHDRYAAPKNLRTVLRLRDATCRFPGCTRSAGRCDLDHTHAWSKNGPTQYENLSHLCRNHHTLKHEGGWNVMQTDDGAGLLRWTAPSGRSYTTEPHRQMVLSGVGGNDPRGSDPRGSDVHASEPRGSDGHGPPPLGDPDRPPF